MILMGEIIDQQVMIDVNVKSLVTSVPLFSHDMVKSGGGKIFNVGLIAVSGPNQAVYYATKAFVNSFSQSLHKALRTKGVTCTLLAPCYGHAQPHTLDAIKGGVITFQRGLSPS